MSANAPTIDEQIEILRDQADAAKYAGDMGEYYRLRAHRDRLIGEKNAFQTPVILTPP